MERDLFLAADAGKGEGPPTLPQRTLARNVLKTWTKRSSADKHAVAATRKNAAATSQAASQSDLVAIAFDRKVAALTPQMSIKSQGVSDATMSSAAAATHHRFAGSPKAIVHVSGAPSTS
eukprot:4216239-Prymnesium_polylepis.1